MITKATNGDWKLQRRKDGAWLIRNLQVIDPFNPRRRWVTVRTLPRSYTEAQALRSYEFETRRER